LAVQARTLELYRQLDLTDAVLKLGHKVIARLRGPQGREETCEARYIAGCDGAHSTVRETIGIGFPGGTYRHVFYVADIEAAGPPIDGELHVDLDEADFQSGLEAGGGSGR
jgi:flavin-dependent dehydrogenase